MINPPLDEIKITSSFGMRVHPVYHTKMMHNGVDLKAAKGTPIYAVDNGKVYVSKWTDTGAGNYVTIKHNGYYSYYAHMSMRVVKAGQMVKAGDIIGYAGSTGASTGPHLHFGLCTRYSAAKINNSEWINPSPELLVVKMTVTKIKPDINGKDVELEAIEYKGSNYVKLRPIAAAMGASVDYDSKTRKITIISKA